MVPPFPEAVRVQPLPWATIEVLTVAMRKLAHDLMNSLVASVSLVDLTAMRNTDANVGDQLARLRTHVMRPRASIQCALAALPGLGDRPKTLPTLVKMLRTTAATQGVELIWLGPEESHELAPGLTEAEWCQVASALVQNALEAHAMAEQDEASTAPRWVDVQWQESRLHVTDNGPGCPDLHAAASCGLRRAGQGHMGLGLAVAAALVERKAGDLHVALNAGGGFQALVRLPGV